MARKYLGCYDPYLTPNEEQLGYPEARKRLAGYDDIQLIREYHEMHRACFGAMFGCNAVRAFNLVVDELLSRGMMEIPNLFGAISIKHWRV